MKLKEACEILGISYENLDSVSDKELREKYRSLAIKYHPDVNNTADAIEMIQALNVAHDLLIKYQKNPSEVIKEEKRGEKQDKLLRYSAILGKSIEELQEEYSEYNSLYNLNSTFLNWVESQVKEKENYDLYTIYADQFDMCYSELFQSYVEEKFLYGDISFGDYLEQEKRIKKYVNYLGEEKKNLINKFMKKKRNYSFIEWLDINKRIKDCSNILGIDKNTLLVSYVKEQEKKKLDNKLKDYIRNLSLMPRDNDKELEDKIRIHFPYYDESKFVVWLEKRVEIEEMCKTLGKSSKILLLEYDKEVILRKIDVSFPSWLRMKIENKEKVGRKR